VLFYVLFVCKCVLPPGDNPIAVNKYISYHISYHSATDMISIFHLKQLKNCIGKVRRSNTDRSTGTSWLLHTYCQHLRE